MDWIKKNKEMTMTIISAILIILGLVIDRQGNHSVAVVTYILAFIIGGWHSFKNAFDDLFRKKKLNVDVLMILAAIGACIIGYWIEGALLIFIFSLAESLETMAMARTTESISALMKVTPDIARLVQADGEIIEVPTQDLKIGDTLQVRKGEAVPIDGQLLREVATLNEAAITGEPLPVTKVKGDAIVGGTINEDNAFTMSVAVENEDTLFSKIIRMVEEAQNAPSKTDSYIQSIENTYVKVVLVAVPLFIILMPFILNWSWEQSFYRGMVLLTVASPCALVASSAPANLSAISRASKNGILFKGGEVIDRVAEIDAVVFDKTGTLTKGQPEVVNELFHDQANQELIKEIVKSAEMTSTHPIAQAFIQYLSDTPDISLSHLEDITGKGFKVLHDGQEWRIGNRLFAFEEEQIPAEQIASAEVAQIQEWEAEGKTVIFISKHLEFQAAFALADQLKEDSLQTIQALHELDIQTIMLTGDEEKTAKYIAAQLGIDEVQANLLPQDKADIIKGFQKKFDHVAMVGDGINDAPALATAEVGFALGSGTDVAMETADVVLIQDDLLQIPFATDLARETKKIVLQNIIFSLAVIAILIIANVFQVINLPLGVVGHEGSTILVILNGLRLLRYRLRK